ncbi:MAG: hypothetical protein FJ290_05290 [Planctomycetes bacterium]|nr:hypothetical protein [Planctomycetota bacterium]
MTMRRLCGLWLALACCAWAGEEHQPPAVDDLPPIRPAATDWPWWRGERQDSIATAATNPPVTWSKTENVVWRADVPGRGHGSPTLWGERIFLPTADEKEKVQYLLCFDRRDGKKLWQTELHRGGFMRLHPKNSHASATPACDGERVFMPFIVQGGIWLDAVGLDGKIVWQKRLGNFESLHGFAASPVFYKSLVIVVADAIKNSFIIAVHRRAPGAGDGSGEVAWKIDRPSYKLGTYASPSVGRVAGRDQLLHQGPYKLFSYDPATGKELWRCDGPDESTCSNPTFDDTHVWAAAGFPKLNLMCVRADGSGDVTKTHLAWMKRDKMAYVPSMLLSDGLLYMVEDEGRLYCFEPKTGEVVWETKLAAKFSASPVLAGGRIYVPSEAGVTYVYKPGRKFELLAQNDLGDGGFATPVFIGDRIYLRTLHSLYCLGKR